MIPHSLEVKDAIVETGLSERVIFQSKLTIWNQVLRLFSSSEYVYPFWEHLNEPISVTYPFAWEWFDSLLSGKEVILFFEPDENDGCFLFDDGGNLMPVLAECYRFTFYLTDTNSSFLLAYNDHENLIACGSAKEWLLNYLNEEHPDLKIWK